MPGTATRVTLVLARAVVPQEDRRVFLHCVGGPMSKYARRIGPDEWSGGEEIRPLSLKEAREWTEENLDANEYKQAFGLA